MINDRLRAGGGWCAQPHQTHERRVSGCHAKSLEMLRLGIFIVEPY